jgi:hypothetical protein
MGSSLELFGGGKRIPFPLSPFIPRQSLLLSIECVVDNGRTAELILSWSRGFQADELSVEDIQEHFARLEVSGTDLPPASQERREAQRELDAIRWGLCETGQRAEIQRVFAELEPWLTGRLAR